MKYLIAIMILTYGVNFMISNYNPIGDGEFILNKAEKAQLNTLE